MKREGEGGEGKLKYGERENERDEEDNDEIPFSSAGPVVALGLTRLRLMEKEKKGGDKKYGDKNARKRRQKAERVTLGNKTKTRGSEKKRRERVRENSRQEWG